MFGLKKYMTGVMLFANIASIIADEQGAQQACNRTEVEPSGVSTFIIVQFEFGIRSYFYLISNS